MAIFIVMFVVLVDPGAVKSENLFANEFGDEDTYEESTVTVLRNLGIIIGMVILSTIGLVICFYFRCYKVLKVWLMIPTIFFLTFVLAIYVEVILKAFNLGFDLITFALFDWNIFVTGMLALHWKGPTKLKRFYLILIAGLGSFYILKLLPKISAWIVLIGLSIWDLFAVLCKYGPLKILLKLHRKRQKANPKDKDGLNILSNLTYGASALCFRVLNVHTQFRPECFVIDKRASPSSRDISKNEKRAYDGEIQNFCLNQNPVHNVDSTIDAEEAPQKDQVINDNRSRRTSGENMSKDDDQDQEKMRLGLGDFVFLLPFNGSINSRKRF